MASSDAAASSASTPRATADGMTLITGLPPSPSSSPEQTYAAPADHKPVLLSDGLQSVCGRLHKLVAECTFPDEAKTTATRGGRERQIIPSLYDLTTQLQLDSLYISYQLSSLKVRIEFIERLVASGYSKRPQPRQPSPSTSTVYSSEDCDSTDGIIRKADISNGSMDKPLLGDDHDDEDDASSTLSSIFDAYVRTDEPLTPYTPQLAQFNEFQQYEPRRLPQIPLPPDPQPSVPRLGLERVLTACTPPLSTRRTIQPPPPSPSSSPPPPMSPAQPESTNFNTSRKLQDCEDAYGVNNNEESRPETPPRTGYSQRKNRVRFLRQRLDHRRRHHRWHRDSIVVRKLQMLHAPVCF